MRIAIFYETVKNGRSQTAEVTTEASSEAAASAKLKRDLQGKGGRVKILGTRVVKK